MHILLMETYTFVLLSVTYLKLMHVVNSSVRAPGR